MLEHVWKTGGSEFCYLVRANGWTTPPTHNCYMNVDYGWPIEDFDFVANERPMMINESGKIIMDFHNVTESNDLEVHDVKWITILRHPYSRSLSHYSHALALNQTTDFTILEFLTHYLPLDPYDFWRYVPNQQTRWHCGWECTTSVLGPEHLAHAMSHLEQFHVVLILEDMKDPQSCTRLQMRHVLNLTKVEVLADLNKTNSTQHLDNILYRRPLTDWYKDVTPHLGPLMFHSTDGGNNRTSTWDELSLQVMAALGLYNEIDLQLYGYARKLCNDRARAIQVPLELQQAQQQQLRNSGRNDTFRAHTNVPPDWTSTADPTPSFTTSLQISSLALISIWMLMLPSIRRLRISVLMRKICRALKHQRH